MQFALYGWRHQLLRAIHVRVHVPRVAWIVQLWRVPHVPRTFPIFRWAATADTCPGVTPTCAATVSRVSPWTSNARTAFRWLSVFLGGIYAGLRALELV